MSAPYRSASSSSCRASSRMMPGGEVEAEAARALLLELTGQAGVAPPAPHALAFVCSSCCLSWAFVSSTTFSSTVLVAGSSSSSGVAVAATLTAARCPAGPAQRQAHGGAEERRHRLVGLLRHSRRGGADGSELLGLDGGLPVPLLLGARAVARLQRRLCGHVCLPLHSKSNRDLTAARRGSRPRPLAAGSLAMARCGGRPSDAAMAGRPSRRGQRWVPLTARRPAERRGHCRAGLSGAASGGRACAPPSRLSSWLGPQAAWRRLEPPFPRRRAPPRGVAERRQGVRGREFNWRGCWFPCP